MDCSPLSWCRNRECTQIRIRTTSIINNNQGIVIWVGCPRNDLDQVLNPTPNGGTSKVSIQDLVDTLLKGNNRSSTRRNKEGSLTNHLGKFQTECPSP